MGRLDGKVAVITGSSGGIGGATAERFVAEGAIVVGVDVAGDADYNVDVTDEDAVRALYASVRERYGRIDVLFNNAGISPNDDASALETGLDAWQPRAGRQPHAASSCAASTASRTCSRPAAAR